jgi:hypothetical protein
MEGSGSQGSRSCVGCGRAIAWDANVCPYCGHDYRYPAAAPRAETISDGMKILFYILSFLIWIAGIIIGVIYYSKDDPESKQVGKNCIIIAIISLVLGTVCGILIWVMALGFSTA